MNDRKYNGWTNYETWRVHLEMFDGMETEDPVDPQTLCEMAVDAVTGSSGDGLARDYALAFLSEVNWQEIADHITGD